ncbi:hypothetical protein Taro_030899, partial [Colocasia esculenta]|nr:hypothetical protein [Colocasia esculenta]
MEGSGSGLPYYFPQRLLHLSHGQGEAGAGFGEAGEAAMLFPSPSSSSAAADGAGNPLLFLQSAAGGRASAVAPAAEPPRRKRGRPRKYGPAAPTSSSPVPPSSSAPAAAAFSPPSSGFGGSKLSPSAQLVPLASSPPPRVSPGRKKAHQEPVGKGERSFTPHLLTVAAGKDVVQEIMSFVQQQRRAVCIISASGTISSATLRQPAMSGGHVTYEGHFDIVSLSGSFLLTETGGSYSRTGALSVCFANTQNTIGGGVSGPLMAAGTVQIFAGSFSVGSDKNIAACANVIRDTVSKLSTPFQEADASPSVTVWSTPDTGHDTGDVGAAYRCCTYYFSSSAFQHGIPEQKVCCTSELELFPYGTPNLGLSSSNYPRASEIESSAFCAMGRLIFAAKGMATSTVRYNFYCAK